MKLAVLAALMAIALPAPALAADWVPAANSIDGNMFYIDRQSIRTMPNGYKRVWEQVDYAKTDKFGDTGAKRYREYDCIERRVRFLSINYFKGNEVTSTDGRGSDWNYISPESINESLFQFVCRR